MHDALVFTRTKHRANRLAEYLVQARHQGRADPRQPLAGAAHRGARRLQERASIAVLVATDIAARGIDVEALGHVVNFDVPHGRPTTTSTASAAPHAPRPRAMRSRSSRRKKRRTSRTIERAIGKRLPRVTVPDFDYNARPEARLEVPLAERIAAIRSRKSDERTRVRGNADRRAARAASRSSRSSPPPESTPGPSESPQRGHPYVGRRSRRRYRPR